MKKAILPLVFIVILLVIITSCKKSSEDEEQPTTTTTTDMSSIKDAFYNCTVNVGNKYITISTNDLPDHKSMYYDSLHPLWEAYDEPSNPDFFKNPNEISSQNYVFTIPRYPEEATTKSSNYGDGLGVTLNGIVLFSGVAAPGDDIFDELHSFDQWEGHPQNTGVYHYHSEVKYLDSLYGSEALLGILTDGFPLYGNMEDGVEITNADLDTYHGHFGATAEFPDGIYHYHITTDWPWINGGEFYGTPGTYTK